MKLRSLLRMWKLRGEVRRLAKTIKEASMETKPGLMTTEFWVTVLSNLMSIVTMVAGWLPPEIGGTIMTFVNAAYTISRGMAKHGVKPG